MARSSPLLVLALTVGLTSPIAFGCSDEPGETGRSGSSGESDGSSVGAGGSGAAGVDDPDDAPVDGAGGGGPTGGAGSGDETSSGGGGGGEPDELVLEGDPPSASSHPATTTHWTLLPDSADFTIFTVESSAGFFAIPPLEPENFPNGFDHCAAPGGDAELNEKQQYARAELKADLKTWYYDVTLLAVPEEDGNTPYRLVVDGDVVAEFTTPDTGTAGAEDRVVYEHTWTTVPIESGQSVQVRARANSNLSITEDEGCRTGPGFDSTYAWARGRLAGIELSPSDL